MDRIAKADIVNRLDYLFSENATEMAEKEMLYDTRSYTDPVVLEKERDNVLRKYPVILGPSSSIQEADEYFTHDISGTPLVVARQRTGGVKVFLNACRHRGARLVHEQAGKRPLFVCRYHAWSYKGDGTSLAVPGGEGFCNTSQGDKNLIEYPAEERHGFIWAILDPNASIDIAEYLGPELDRELASYELETFRSVRSSDVVQPINWKFFLEGFLETYHFAALHQNTVAPYFVSNRALCSTYGPHVRMVAARREYEREREKVGDGLDPLTCTAVTYTIFPNTVIELLSDRKDFHFEVWSCFPHNNKTNEGIGRAHLMARADKSGPEFQDFWDKNWKITLDTVVGEDLWVCQGTQAAAETGNLGTIVFGRNEPALQHIHQQLLQRREQVSAA